MTRATLFCAMCFVLCTVNNGLRSSDLTIKELHKTANTVIVNSKRATHILIDFLPSSHGDRDLTKLRRRQQAERQKSNRFNKQNNNSALVSRFFVHFFAVSRHNYNEK